MTGDGAAGSNSIYPDDLYDWDEPIMEPEEPPMDLKRRRNPAIWPERPEKFR